MKNLRAFSSLVPRLLSFFVVQFAFSILHESGRARRTGSSFAFVYYTERKLKNTKRGRPGNEPSFYCNVHSSWYLECWQVSGFLATRSTLTRSTLTRSICHEIKLPRDQIATRSTLTRSTLTRSNCHEINSHEINSHQIKLPRDQLSRDQLSPDQLNFILC